MTLNFFKPGFLLDVLWILLLAMGLHVDAFGVNTERTATFLLATPNVSLNYYSTVVRISPIVERL